MSQAASTRKRSSSAFDKHNLRNSVFLDPEEQPVLKEGDLHKKSSGLIQRWQKRHFTLQGHYFKYGGSASADDGDATGAIDLRNVESIASIEPDGHFLLKMSNGAGEAHLKAATLELAQSWVTQLWRLRTW